MNLLKEKKGVGVIVCRMQVPYLTASHQSIVTTALERHQRVVIFLGTTGKIIDEKNPFPYTFRKSMIEWTFSEQKDKITIVPLPDMEDNKQWVETLDRLINAFLAYDEDAILYGGRDSFIPFYTKENGKFNTIELAPTDYDSGTELRALSSLHLPQYSSEVAQSILWTIRQMNGKEDAGKENTTK